MTAGPVSAVHRGLPLRRPRRCTPHAECPPAPGTGSWRAARRARRQLQDLTGAGALSGSSASSRPAARTRVAASCTVISCCRDRSPRVLTAFPAPSGVSKRHTPGVDIRSPFAGAGCARLHGAAGASAAASSAGDESCTQDRAVRVGPPLDERGSARPGTRRRPTAGACPWRSPSVPREAGLIRAGGRRPGRRERTLLVRCGGGHWSTRRRRWPAAPTSLAPCSSGPSTASGQRGRSH
jgi:hypothetical protein